MAREPHGELGQLLTALKMDAVALKAMLSEKEQLLRIERMDALLTTTITATRRISSERPAVTPS